MEHPTGSLPYDACLRPKARSPNWASWGAKISVSPSNASKSLFFQRKTWEKEASQTPAKQENSYVGQLIYSPSSQGSAFLQDNWERVSINKRKWPGGLWGVSRTPRRCGGHGSSSLVSGFVVKLNWLKISLKVITKLGKKKMVVHLQISPETRDLKR